LSEEVRMAETQETGQEEIARQQALLATYRRTLAHLLQQAARYGGEISAPPNVSNGIYEAREYMRQIKVALRARNVFVEDAPEDEPPLPPRTDESSVRVPISPTKTIGTLRNVAIDRGDNREGSVDSRQGVLISGGTVYGPVVGNNVGAITTTYGGPIPADPPHDALESTLAQLHQAATQARQRDDDDLAEDLEGILRVIQQGIKARSDGKIERLAAKLHGAREMLERLAKDHPMLVEIARMLDQMA
jgi:hypothetical protein